MHDGCVYVECLSSALLLRTPSFRRELATPREHSSGMYGEPAMTFDVHDDGRTI